MNKNNSGSFSAAAIILYIYHAGALYTALIFKMHKKIFDSGAFSCKLFLTFIQ